MPRTLSTPFETRKTGSRFWGRLMSYKSRLLAAVAALSMAAGAGEALAQSAPVAPLAAEARFDIPAQDLGAALMAFSRISGVAISA